MLDCKQQRHSMRFRDAFKPYPVAVKCRLLGVVGGLLPMQWIICNDCVGVFSLKREVVAGPGISGGVVGEVGAGDAVAVGEHGGLRLLGSDGLPYGRARQQLL